MRAATALLTVAVLLALAGAVVVGLGIDRTDSERLDELWISETARDNEVNHHPIGLGPDDRVIVAPVAAVPNAEEITATSCSLVRLDPSTGSVLWRASIDPEACYSHALTEPSIADLDGDGSLSVVVATTEEAVIGYDAADGTESFRLPLPSYGYGAPVVATLGTERVIVVSSIQGDLVVARGEQEIEWQRSLDGVVWATPVVADVDGDGRSDVLVGTSDRTVVFDTDGALKWERPGRVTRTAVGPIPETNGLAIFTAGERTVSALDGADGTAFWEVTFDARAAIKESSVDDDGTTHLFVGLSSQEVVALDAGTGRELWRTRLTSGRATTLAPPVLGDVDGDGTPAVIAAATDGTVSVLDADSGEKRATYERPVPVWTFPTVGDIDGDGRDEILVRYGDGRVVALAYPASE